MSLKRWEGAWLLGGTARRPPWLEMMMEEEGKVEVEKDGGGDEVKEKTSEVDKVL